MHANVMTDRRLLNIVNRQLSQNITDSRRQTFAGSLHQAPMKLAEAREIECS